MENNNNAAFVDATAMTNAIVASITVANMTVTNVNVPREETTIITRCVLSWLRSTINHQLKKMTTIMKKNVADVVADVEAASEAVAVVVVGEEASI